MSKEINALLDELVEGVQNSKQLAESFCKKHSVYDWMPELYNSLLDLPQWQRERCYTMEQWTNPRTVVEIYVTFVYEASKPMLKEVVSEDS